MPDHTSTANAENGEKDTDPVLVRTLRGWNNRKHNWAGFSSTPLLDGWVEYCLLDSAK